MIFKVPAFQAQWFWSYTGLQVEPRPLCSVEGLMNSNNDFQSTFTLAYVLPIFSRVIPWYFWVQNFNHFGKLLNQLYKTFVDKYHCPLWISVLIIGLFQDIDLWFAERASWCIFCLSCKATDTISFNMCLVSFFIAASCNKECYNFNKVIILSDSTIAYA